MNEISILIAIMAATIKLTDLSVTFKMRALLHIYSSTFSNSPPPGGNAWLMLHCAASITSGALQREPEESL